MKMSRFFSGLRKARPTGLNVSSHKYQSRLRFEVLEDRCVPAGVASYDYIVEPLNGGAAPLGSPGVVGLTPSQIRTAYGFNAVNFGGIVGDGTGQTIAIIDAYDNPKFVNSTSASFASSDLHQFDVAFGLADPPSFRKVNQTGGSTYPTGNTGWGGEIALDVEWAHALAPKANILLVEANSNSYNDLFAAVNYAKSVAGVSVVSMSFGGSEFSTETSLDSTFTTPAGHSGVTFVASTGDAGRPGGYPAYSSRVLAVGGTRVNLGAGGSYISESGWSGSGGGISTYEVKPSYQSSVTFSSTRRTIPDVSFDADPNSGVAVYDSYANGTSAPWVQVGGTSFSAPAWAALLAITNQGRVNAGLGTLNGFSETLPKIYALPSSDFHDVTTGNNGYAAAAGYDLVTGRGSPIANLVARDLAGSNSTPPPPPPAGDAFEPDDTLATAARLGAVSGSKSWSNLSIHTSTDTDWYQFSINSAGTAANFARIDFTHASGDLDLFLYNSSGTLVGSSEGTGNSEQVSLSGLAAGTYYARVIGYNGATNPSYALTLNGPSGTSSSGTFSASDLPLGIFDNTTTVSSLNIPTDLAISKLTVQLNISHTYDSDLYIYLISPAGRAVLLSNRRGGAGDNFSNTVFDSTAGTSITSGFAPFSGIFRPEGSLSVLNGLDAKGTWQLVVQDRASLDQGTLNRWSITVQGTPGTGAGPAFRTASSSALPADAATVMANLHAGTFTPSMLPVSARTQEKLGVSAALVAEHLVHQQSATNQAAPALASYYHPAAVPAQARQQAALLTEQLLALWDRRL
jgi:subtilisin-like proprotein convertase family protein